MPRPSAEFPSLPPAAGAVAALGAFVALFGAYWDDAWHTDKGRDDFFIAPHITLYSGVLVSGLVVAGWMIAGWRAQQWSVPWTLAALRRAPAAALALVGAVITLASAPIDNTWHELYGRDAVLWSPPHMLGVVGSAALAVGILAGVIPTTARGDSARSSAWGGVVRTLLAAGVLGSVLVPVLEFDSDVPQFPAWTYWPVVTAGVVLFLMLLRDLVPGSGVATRVAAVYMLAKLLIIAGLALMDHSLTVLPFVILVAVVDDALYARGVGALARGLTGAVTVSLAWALSAATQPGVATQVPLEQVPLAVGASLAAAAVVVVASGHTALPRLRPAAALTVLVVASSVLSLAFDQRVAWAHDPGQGTIAGRVDFTVDRSGDAVRVEATVAPTLHTCDELRPRELVARRAGDVRRAPLGLTGCQVTGTLSLSPGRWFVYVELVDAAGHHREPVTYESWLPVAADTQRLREIRDLYEPTVKSAGTSAAQVFSGVVLYIIVAALLAASLRLARATGRRRASDSHSPVAALRPPT
jgi:hypothetical protein